MPNYVKDEINFHIFLNAMRDLHMVSLDRVCEGLCSASMVKRIESGERLPEKLLRDRILERMGVSQEEYEDYLSIEEYAQWELRENILNAIQNKNPKQARKELAYYQKNMELNSVSRQYCGAMEFMILQLENASLEKQSEVIEYAVKSTMPQMDQGLSENMLLSAQEINLYIEYIRLRSYSGTDGEFEWRFRKYQEILNYIEHSHLDSFCRAKVFPKAVYYMCEMILRKARTEKYLKLGIDSCNQAIELLRESKRLYYIIELIEVSELLVKEAECCFGGEKKQEEIAKLRLNLAEKQKWYRIFMALYGEYDICPYMEDDCYLYNGMTSYCIGDVIRIRREMLGMEKEQLCRGICSVKTLTRIEHKKVKTHMIIVRQLFKRLGLCAEYIRSQVITSNYEAMKLAEKHTEYVNNQKLEEWEHCLEQLEQKLCMEIPQNKQFILYSRYHLKLYKEEISTEAFIEGMFEIIGYTATVDAIVTSKERFLSLEEYSAIRAIAMRADQELAEKYMGIIREFCEKTVNVYLDKKTFLMTSLISYLGNIGNYEESDRLSNQLMEENLIARRSEELAGMLYNNLWNKQECLAVKSEEWEKIIKDCIALSEYNKSEKLINFFRKKFFL